MGWAGSTMGERTYAYKMFVEFAKRKRPFGSLRRRLINNIESDLKEIGRYNVDWILVCRDKGV
jgi:hypothetical protein